MGRAALVQGMSYTQHGQLLGAWGEKRVGLFEDNRGLDGEERLICRGTVLRRGRRLDEEEVERQGGEPHAVV